MKRRSMMGLALAGLAAFVVSASLVAGDIDLKDIKCPVSNRDAVDKEGTSLEHNGGKVFFCCTNCPNAFKNDTKKFAAKANQQLVATGQAKQVKCPIAGRDLNKATEIKVAGTKVSFCCNNCKGRAERAEGDEQLTLIFGEEAFKKGFEVKKEKD